MRNPRQHQIFGLNNATGLSTVLSGACMRRSDTAHARISEPVHTSCGPLPPNPQELLDRTQFTQALDDWSRQYDVILLRHLRGLARCRCSHRRRQSQQALCADQAQQEQAQPSQSAYRELIDINVSWSAL
jgi:hypothetical protein